jgi:2-polyprenyl-3-methyl-5-hydroxy-6-metoxy-1,4-benzoquinol methylase
VAGLHSTSRATTPAPNWNAAGQQSADRRSVGKLAEAVEPGFYAKKQVHSQSRLISASHRARFALGLRLAQQLGGARVLDHGCGDGTFLALLLDGTHPPTEAVGTEIDAHIVDDCRRRFGAHDALRFELTTDLERPEHAGQFDTIYCMEVLEHVIDPALELDRMWRLLAPGGALLISVPIEIGVPVMVKQVVRRVAGWRGVGHYPGTAGYTPVEMLRTLVAGDRQHIDRPVYQRPDGLPFHDHKGFNWRVLRTRIRERFDLERESTSPVGWLGHQLGTQRWFVARKRAL